LNRQRSKAIECSRVPSKKEKKMIKIELKKIPELDPGFVPASLWKREYKKLVESTENSERLIIATERSNGMISTFDTEILPHEGEFVPLNIKHVERLVKSMLWIKGGYKVTIAGNSEIATKLAEIYSPDVVRSFDNDLIGKKVYGKDIEVINCPVEDAPRESESKVALGRNFKGCRIGFDLGGSDRKCAAVVDGEVIFSEEIEWSPYFQSDPAWHKAGINDSLKRAAAKMPRVDAIGGSAAGVYVDNQVRAASLFRGVSPEDFDKSVKNIFIELGKEWDVPFEVINDGEVTALAGSISINDNSLLGVAMGTSQAAGYISPDGNVTDWLNELAFSPVDYRDDAPEDEWSGDIGCGVQYFSQQGVARLAPAADIEFPAETPFPEQLIEVQKLMEDGDARAEKIYNTIGTYFGYAIADYAEFYEIRNLMVLGRVTSGKGGEIILKKAKEVLKAEFPELADIINFQIPDEKMKRHGQAVAAASLPEVLA